MQDLKSYGIKMVSVSAGYYRNATISTLSYTSIIAGFQKDRTSNYFGDGKTEDIVLFTI